jgi:hypothetical protein
MYLEGSRRLNEGKTTYYRKHGVDMVLVLLALYVDPPDGILYCHGIHQALFEEMEKTIHCLSFHKGLPSMETVEEFTAERRYRARRETP